MRLALAGLACALYPVAASADAGSGAPGGSAPAQTSSEHVIGGTNAAPGKWPDVAAILFPDSSGDLPECSGTLIAPSVVLTAGHCYDVQAPPLPDNVLIGTSSLARPQDGETIAIAHGYAFPDAINSEDLAVLVLTTPSSRTPRPIATGWAHLDILDGAAISLVGFGAVDKAGDQFVDELQEARTTITDFNCSKSSGCNAAARPAGELGAGGMGVDTCPGDSGGPLYLITSYGAFLAGVTSRSYDNARVACSGGGIYERPDKVIDWIEAMAGGGVARGPAPEADPIVAVHGDAGETSIRANDPRTSSHSFAITAPPAHGTARVRGDGAVRVCTDPDAAPGSDQLTVTITDSADAGRALSLAIAIEIEDGTAPATACNFDDFSAGCCDTGGRSGGAVVPAIGVLVFVMRRRR